MSHCQFFRLFAALAFLLTGCSGTLPNGHRWGEDATLAPGWRKVGNAAWNALKSPEVWAPAVGALALQINDADEKVSDWAVKHHPVFSDEDDAEDASDNLRSASYIAYGVSFLATPSGPLDWGWAKSKAKALGVGLAAYGLTDVTTNYLKDTTNRDRPNDHNDHSFPSAHASQSAVYSILADRNIRAMNIPRWAKITSKVGLTAIPLATGWARVEAEKHYPADVLAGMALGHFFGIFIHDAFMGIDQEVISLTLETGPESWFAGVTFNY
jgi:hypothetical protein